VDAETLHEALGCSVERAEAWAAPLTSAMDAYGINTPERQAMFLAQIGHESGKMKYVRELWGPTAQQERYEGRADLGNTSVGDGFKYRGRGLIQVTGKDNYRRVGAALGLQDILERPELLEQPQHAANSAAWFWSTHGLNEMADAGDIIRATRKINGGTIGLDERRKLWVSAKLALGLFGESQA
jgi:putative chitinase